jgi:trimethylamine--corrinoid protein Co-methyltransferase
MIQQFATVLSPEQVEAVHQAALEILAEVGLLVRNARAREILTHHGVHVDPDTQVARFPRTVVEHHRQSYPSTYTFYARDPQYDRTIPGDGPVFMTGSSAPNVIDPSSGDERRGRSDDMARIAHLTNELDFLDLFSVSILCDDAPEGHFSLSRFYPALKNTLKPVRGNVPDVAEAEKVIRLGQLVAGGVEAYRERPLIAHHYCAVVSPLTLDFDSTELLIHLTENGYPGYATVVPNAGLTSPLTLMGTLAQGNAEFLAWATLKQMVRPGAELIYSVLPTVGDMRTGAYAPGGVETGIMAMAFAQMARYYDLPCSAYVGMTNAKLVDAQAGFEKAMSPTAALLAGVDLMNVAGLLDALMAFDFGMLAVDDEIAGMIKRIRRGMEFNADNLALDLIREVGPAGMFLDHEHTLDRMKTAALLPEVADRDPRASWLLTGGEDAQSKALQKAHRILSTANPAVFSGDLDRKIRTAFPEIVAGDSIPPQDWPQASAVEEVTRGRRRSRRRGQKA